MYRLWRFVTWRVWEMCEKNTFWSFHDSFSGGQTWTHWTHFKKDRRSPVTKVVIEVSIIVMLFATYFKSTQNYTYVNYLTNFV